MAEPFAEQDWIADLASKERERRAMIDHFQAAAHVFIDVLVTALAGDAEKYQREFPGSRVLISPDKETGSITVTCSAYHPATKATIQMHSENQHVSYFYQDTGRSRDWEETLKFSSVGIHSMGVSPEYTATQLSKKVLKPILFPAL